MNFKYDNKIPFWIIISIDVFIQLTETCISLQGNNEQSLKSLGRGKNSQCQFIHT